jgi:hypothetical protein
VSLALTWPCRCCLLRVFLWASATSFPLSKHWERWHCTHILRPACLFTVHEGSGSSPLSCAVFLPPPLLQAFLLLITGQCCCSCQPPYLFTAQVGTGSSLLSCVFGHCPNSWHKPHKTDSISWASRVHFDISKHSWVYADERTY